mmetsp:Transcript_21186/g.59923  ORF Transcript_21186/g.59923 Transcript_21186/m.59923 type:complete len:299 (+) Transcript_21186:322-1218(+)
MIFLGSSPLRSSLPVELRNTSHLGGRMLGRASFSFSSSFALAGSSRGVWMAPMVLPSLLCSAPFVSTMVFKASMAFRGPPHVKPLGKSSWEIWQTAPPHWVLASWQKVWRAAFSRPATDSEAWSLFSTTSAMASLQAFTSVRPVLKLRTPATVSAVYSPTKRPATAVGRSAASGLVSRSCSMPARQATYMAGIMTLGCSSLDSGPLRQASNTSKSRIPLATLTMRWTPGLFWTSSIIFTYCEPWPGNTRPTPPAAGAGAAAGATTHGSSVSASGREAWTVSFLPLMGLPSPSKPWVIP